MAIIKRVGLIGIIFSLAGGIFWRGSHAQASDRRYFPETGHTVANEFLAFYESVDSPLLLFGYPITDAFQDQTTKLQVQYFQKARFELHPELPEGKQVVLSTLGELTYVPGDKIPLPPHFPACKAFATPNGKFQVCYDFLDFFLDHGGVSLFGLPISNFEVQELRIKQCFQNACFEWYPELPLGQKVRVADLGTHYFRIRRENPNLLKPVNGMPIPQTILRLQVNAFARKAVTGMTDEQTVYVIVRDQNLHPVSNAKVTLVIRQPSGEESEHKLDSLTDPNGVASFSFSFQAESQGVIQVWATASFNDLSTTSLTSFRIWW